MPIAAGEPEAPSPCDSEGKDPSLLVKLLDTVPSPRSRRLGTVSFYRRGTAPAGDDGGGGGARRTASACFELRAAPAPWRTTARRTALPQSPSAGGGPLPPPLPPANYQPKARAAGAAADAPTPKASPSKPAPLECAAPASLQQPAGCNSVWVRVEDGSFLKQEDWAILMRRGASASAAPPAHRAQPEHRSARPPPNTVITELTEALDAVAHDGRALRRCWCALCVHLTRAPSHARGPSGAKHGSRDLSSMACGGGALFCDARAACASASAHARR